MRIIWHPSTAWWEKWDSSRAKENLFERNYYNTTVISKSILSWIIARRMSLFVHFGFFCAKEYARQESCARQQKEEHVFGAVAITLDAISWRYNDRQRQLAHAKLRGLDKKRVAIPPWCNIVSWVLILNPRVVASCDKFQLLIFKIGQTEILCREGHLYNSICLSTNIRFFPLFSKTVQLKS